MDSNVMHFLQKQSHYFSNDPRIFALTCNIHLFKFIFRLIVHVLILYFYILKLLYVFLIYNNNIIISV